MTDVAEAAAEFRDLAVVLAQVGLDGLRRELYKAVSDAAEPVADTIKNSSHLREYMPNRYAGVLAGDLQVTTHKHTGRDPGVAVMARAPTLGRGGRKIRQRNEGRITHPLFGNRKFWYVQEAGMVPRFFDDPAERAAPQVRDQILEAMRRVADEATRRP